MRDFQARKSFLQSVVRARNILSREGEFLPDVQIRGLMVAIDYLQMHWSIPLALPGLYADRSLVSIGPDVEPWNSAGRTCNPRTVMSKKPQAQIVRRATCFPRGRRPVNSLVNRTTIPIQVIPLAMTRGSENENADRSRRPTNPSPMPVANPNVSIGTEIRMAQRLRRASRSRFGTPKPSEPPVDGVGGLKKVHQRQDQADDDPQHPQNQKPGVEHLPPAKNIEMRRWGLADKVGGEDTQQHDRQQEYAHRQIAMEQRERQVGDHRQPREDQKPVVSGTEQGRKAGLLHLFKRYSVCATSPAEAKPWVMSLLSHCAPENGTTPAPSPPHSWQGNRRPGRGST